MKVATKKTVFHALFGLASITTLAPAWAGTSLPIIGYAPAGAESALAVPTLSEWGLIAMALLVAVMAYRGMQGRLGGRSVKSVAAAGLLGFAALHAGGWIKSALAAPPSVDLSQDGGGLVPLPYAPGVDVAVTNTSTVAQKIVSINPNNANTVFVAPAANPQCVLGLRVAVNDTCYIKYQLGIP